jgi:arginase family enzyme
MESALNWDAKHLTWPGLLRAQRQDGAFSLHNPQHGTSLDVEEESRELVEALLKAFEPARPPREVLEEDAEFPPELLILMVRSGFIVEESELAFLEHGFLRPPHAPIGEACSWSDLPERAQPAGWAVVGVPVDLASGGLGGARLGPSEIRKLANHTLISGEGDVIDHDFKRLYPAFLPNVIDLGDVDPEGARMDHVGARLQKVVRELLRLGVRPLLLGGDHSITHYALLELMESAESFGILHFDAHADLGPSRVLSHANVFGAALRSPRVKSLVQIGLRGVERVNPYASREACAKRTVISAREVKQGLALAALEQLPTDLPYYLSFDIDCLDGALARETGMPLFGGLDFDRALELVDLISRRFQLLGADFVEVAGGQSGSVNAAASIAVSLLQRCLLGESPWEELSTDRYVL